MWRLYRYYLRLPIRRIHIWSSRLRQEKNTDVFGNATILTLVNPARICYLYLIGKQDVETLLETMPYRVEETRGCT